MRIPQLAETEQRLFDNLLAQKRQDLAAAHAQEESNLATDILRRGMIASSDGAYFALGRKHLLAREQLKIEALNETLLDANRQWTKELAAALYADISDSVACAANGLCKEVRSRRLRMGILSAPAHDVESMPEHVGWLPQTLSELSRDLSIRVNRALVRSATAYAPACEIAPSAGQVGSSSGRRTDRRGVGILTEAVATMGWILREQTVDDYGIDAQIEVARDGTPTGRLIAVQLKSGKSWFKEGNENGYVYRGDMSHLNYWRNHSLPVIVVICDVDTRTCLWQCINASTVTVLPKRWKTMIPRRHILDLNHLAEIELVIDSKEQEITQRRIDAERQDIADDLAFEDYREDQRNSR